MLVATLTAALVAIHAAAECTDAPSPAHPFEVAPGFSAQLVTGGLTKPRGIIFDSSGALLVVEAGARISRLTLKDGGDVCVTVDQKTSVIEDPDFTHGIEVDGGTLYASTPEAVYSWAYDANTGAATNRRTVVSNMTSPSHPTRTLLLSRLQENTLLVSRGSGGNLDMLAASQDSGISQLRSFNLGTLADNSSYDYANDGTLMAWGLRNSVGVAEHPTAGGIWTVENSADQIHRLGEDIHKDNPGEEVNYHGVLGQESNTTGRNYGYPHCLALWNTTDFPDIGSMTVGSQFSFEESSETDDACNSEFVAPRLTFQAHTAPLDIKFVPKGDLAYIAQHGSWNREEPVGYKLTAVKWDASGGQPEEAADSTTAFIDIVISPDLSKCPDECFRPVALALDSQGRIFMSSDSTGEIFVVKRKDGAALPKNGWEDSGTRTTAVASASGVLAAVLLAIVGTVDFA